MTGGDMPRPLSDIERGVIARMLAVPFPGRDELDGEGYLSCLEVYSIGDEPVRRLPPAEQINARPQG